MLRTFTFLLLVLSFLTACSSQRKNNTDIEITFQVEAPDLSSDSTIFITGNHEKLGTWIPDRVAMKNIGEQKWEVKIKVPKSEVLEYKFTKGSWSNEAADATGLPLANKYFKGDQDTVLITSIHFWRSGEELSVVGQVTGDVRYHKALEGKGILPRDVIVWLPPSYDKEQDKKYPVLYMHDGQNIFDPQTASFKVDWQVDETATKLIKEGAIEELIIIGVYCTENRTKEYTPTEEGQEYMRFIVNKLKPLIDKTYRTKSEREYTATGGSSAGGLISFMLLWEYSDVFSKAICMSPAFKIQNIDYVSPVVNSSEIPKNIQVYIDNGGVGLEEKLQPGIDEMLTALKAKGFEEGENLIWVYDAEAKHFESDWAERMPFVLEQFYRKSKPY